jgi:hypothetical protein
MSFPIGSLIAASFHDHLALAPIPQPPVVYHTYRFYVVSGTSGKREPGLPDIFSPPSPGLALQDLLELLEKPRIGAI